MFFHPRGSRQSPAGTAAAGVHGAPRRPREQPATRESAALASARRRPRRAGRELTPARLDRRHLVYSYAFLAVFVRGYVDLALRTALSWSHRRSYVSCITRALSTERRTPTASHLSSFLVTTPATFPVFRLGLWYVWYKNHVLCVTALEPTRAGDGGSAVKPSTDSNIEPFNPRPPPGPPRSGSGSTSLQPLKRRRSTSQRRLTTVDRRRQHNPIGQLTTVITT
ncbi:hypothetical protein BV898_19529 [Hypsibius exemplaris]|uniref:Uncharacterized protein n=1 Tax=Hypsibius exemplaris TaxID=2072580 RepID=A0A9X6NJQ7_HYPEX|nr:hypothetical protein BV898_19529 [Hypsibius exemplaris]